MGGVRTGCLVACLMGSAASFRTLPRRQVSSSASPHMLQGCVSLLLIAPVTSAGCTQMAASSNVEQRCCLEAVPLLADGRARSSIDQNAAALFTSNSSRERRERSRRWSMIDDRNQSHVTDSTHITNDSKTHANSSKRMQQQLNE